MNKFFYLLSFLFFVFILTISSCKEEECPDSRCDDLGILTIVVTRQSSIGVVEKLENVIVEIIGANINSRETDENGRVQFELCPGEYSYKLLRDNYEQALNNQSRLIVKCGVEETASLRMRPTRPILRISPESISLTRSNSERVITVKNDGVNTLEWEASILGDENWIEIVGENTGQLGAGQGEDVRIRVDFDNFLTAGGAELKNIRFIDRSRSSNSVEATVYVIPELVFDVSPGDITFGRLENFKEFTISLTKNISSPLSLSITSSGLPEGALSISPSQATLSLNGQVENISLSLDRNALPGYGFFQGKIFIDAGSNGVEVIDIRIDHPSPDNPYLEVESSSVNPALLAFGSTSLQKTLTLKNSGQGTLMWNIVENFPTWIEPVSLTTGQLSVNQEAVITFTADRTNLVEGQFYSEQLEINSNGGNKLISATISKGDPILESNSLVRFPFSGNVDNFGTFIDDMAYYTNASFTTDPMGTSGKAISFDGDSSYMSFINPIQSEPSFSVSFWIKNLTHTSAPKTVISLKGNTWFEVKIQDDRLNIIQKYGSSFSSKNEVICNSPLDENWNHVVILYNKESASQRTLVVYINGVNSGFTVLGNTSFHGATGIKTSIGCLHSSGDTRTEYWQGNLDDFRIYPNILSENQINILGGGN